MLSSLVKYSYAGLSAFDFCTSKLVFEGFSGHHEDFILSHFRIVLANLEIKFKRFSSVMVKPIKRTINYKEASD